MQLGIGPFWFEGISEMWLSAIPRRRALVFAGATGAVFIGGAITLAAVHASGGKPSARAAVEAAAAASPTPLTPSQLQCLKRFDLTTTEASFRKLPAAQQRLYLARAQNCVNVLAAPSRTPAFARTAGAPVPTVSDSIPKPHRTAGAGTIVESRLAPVPGVAFKAQNQWFETKNGVVIAVYAGAGTEQDENQGIVVVQSQAEHAGGVPAAVPADNMYRTPTKSGPVHITDADGERLTLLSTDGTKFVFDVASRTFLPVP